MARRLENRIRRTVEQLKENQHLDRAEECRRERGARARVLQGLVFQSTRASATTSG